MPSVGEILAAERRRQGKSLADAVEGTKIRSRLLEALENGKYDELPSSAYVKGYIQSYARFLEIPVEPLLGQFKHEYGLHVKSAPSPSDRYLKMSATELRQLPADEVVPVRDKMNNIPQNVWFAVAAATILVALGICGLSLSCSSRQAGGPRQPAGVQQPSSDVTASPGETMPAEATTTVSEIANAFKLRVTVRVGQASWLQVMVDGQKAFEGTLADGESREWLVSQKAVVRAGRPEVVTVLRDGVRQAMKQIGGSGVLTLNAGQ